METRNGDPDDQAGNIPVTGISRQRHQILEDLLRDQATATSDRPPLLPAKDGLHADSSRTDGRT